MSLMLDADMLYSLGIIMIFVGIIVILAAFVVLFLSSIKSGKIRGGGALIIGPIPIVFGTDKESVKAVLWLSITLTIILFAVFIILYLLRGR
ncbi:MAG: DUF131 domain-containing protein [Candidatus Bathyarchaeota archaeon]|jgi:uncharacterized membrane protein|nr:DUF131 domain-containing protein [Candidatus Bathyarchaeota archaeon A05DMB-3]MDH7607207.1 DUF131 domain-containing protein [Candidatus Bathyarchaeota archaeon]